MMLSEQELLRLKETEIEIFKAFIGACNELKLTYYLLGGTLLGAVRHKGFIPWDDDIDVGMPRKDYLRFISEAQKLLPDFYFVQTKQSDPDYPLNFAKIRDSRTTFIETSLSNFKINHGVFIDVFPLDFYPDSKIGRSVFDFRQTLMKYRLRSSVIIPDESRHGKTAEFVLTIAEKVSRVFYADLDCMQKKKDRMYQSAKNGSMIGNFNGAWGKKEIVPAEWYKEGTELVFEGIKVNVPMNYSAWLQQVYGNYLEFPPVEKRVSHHYLSGFDLDKSYIEYKEE